MFFPSGTPVHENLATSYVLVDALVEDLCEGGFSGVVEVLLRNSDCHVVVNRGRVVAVIEQDAEGRSEKTTVRDVAGRSRKERGRISVVAYPQETAEIVASRVEAEPLYSRLTTEFADPARMIDKLRREPDREWFIELRLLSGLTALLYLNEDRSVVVTSRHGGTAPGGESALIKLLDECSSVGGSFDVCFKAPVAALVAGEVEPELEQEELKADAAPFLAAAATAHSTAAVENPVPSESRLNEPPHDSIPGSVDQHPEITRGEGLPRYGAGTADTPTADLSEEALPRTPIEAEPAETLAEVKRLMGEVIRTIESVTGAGDPRDSFSLSLRAGQLNVADRYPFLDPFGSEFEYYAGEIAFVGSASPDDFVEGLTEALRLAVRSTIDRSSQPERLSARIEDALRQLVETQREELHSYGLDKSIGIIIGSNVSHESVAATNDSAE